jgi:hypothetical protein
MKKARSTAVALALTLITTPLWAQTPSPTTPSYSSGLTGASNSAADTSPSLPAQQAPPPTVAPAALAAANTNTSVKRKHPAARTKPARAMWQPARCEARIRPASQMIKSPMKRGSPRRVTLHGQVNSVYRLPN